MRLDMRVDHDLIGDCAIDADSYYGVHTRRAIHNLPVSGISVGA